MNGNTIEYKDGDNVLEGYYVSPDSEGPHPLVLIAHDWSGRNDFAENKAKLISTARLYRFCH